MRDNHLHLAVGDGLARLKWEWEAEKSHYDDLLCFGTADMDWQSPGPLLDALEDVITKGHLGYPMVRDEFYSAIEDHLKDTTGWKIDGESAIAQGVGVYTSAWSFINILTGAGDKVAILSPVHMCYKSVLSLNGRVPIECQLVYKDGKYTIDYNSLEACLASGCRVLWLCNPHNPIGHAWSRDELERIAKLVLKYDAYIISDDVYASLVYPGTVYTPIASLSKKISMRTVSLYSTSKSCNTTGLKHCYIVTENPELLKAYTDSLLSMQLSYGLNIMGMAATIAAYRQCGPWLDELNSKLQENHNHLSSFIQSQLPGAGIAASNSIYFAWIDMRRLRLLPKQLSYMIKEEEHMIVENGAEQGRGGDGFIRFNIACSDEHLKAGAERLKSFWQRHVR